MKTIFTKQIGKSLTGSSKRHKKQRKEENMETNPKCVWTRYVLLTQKGKIKRRFMP
jgi:hypothetical protein